MRKEKLTSQCDKAPQRVFKAFMAGDGGLKPTLQPNLR